MNKISIGALAIGLSVSLPLLALNAEKHSTKQKINGQDFTTKNSPDNGKEEVWISIGTDAVSLVNRLSSVPFFFKNVQPAQVIKHTNVEPNTNVSSQAVNVVSIDKSALGKLSEFMHDNFKRCGGFIFHDSLAEALKYTEKAANISGTQSLVNYTIDNPDGVNSLLSELSSANLASTVNTLDNYHNRYYTSSTGQQAAEWIKDHWSSIASTRNDINVELYSHSWQQSSVIATVAGTTNNEEIVIVGGHLDSINLSNPLGGKAPGADDNASGIAVLTETLRAIVASDFKPKRTVKFIGYAAEEVGLRGSGDIAQDYKTQGKQVIGVAQFDMSGYKGTSNKDIVFMTDYTNSAQNNFMTQLIDTYLNDISYGFDQCGYGCSDHASWHNRGYAASMPFESNMNDYNPSIHTSSDTSFDAGHSFNFARLASAYVAELAKSGDVIIPPDTNVLENNVPVSVSGAAKAEMFYTFDVPADATSLSFNTSGGTGDADLYVKFNAKPTTNLYDCNSTSSSSTEQCSISSIQTGTYHVMVQAWNEISNVNLVANYQTDTTPPESELQNGVPVTNLSGNRGQDLEYTMVVPAGATNIRFEIKGGSGDADLFVKYGEKPTDRDYDCRPYLNGNNETCPNLTDTSGTYFIRINGYRAFSGVTLVGSYD